MNFMMKGKRILSLLLAIVLVFCVIPPQTMAVEGNENDASVIGKAVKINSNFGGTIRFAPGDATYYFYVASYFPKVMDIVAVEEVGGVTYYQVKAAANFTWSPNATYTEYDADIWIKSTEVDFVQPCDKCGKLDCESSHENWCEICRVDDCTNDHINATVTDSEGKEQTITVAGKLPQGAGLVVSEVEKPEFDFDNEISVYSYDISLHAGGNKIQPSAPVTVVFDNVKLYDGGFVDVYHVLDTVAAIQSCMGASNVGAVPSSEIGLAGSTAESAAYAATGEVGIVYVEVFSSLDGTVSIGENSASITVSSFSPFYLVSGNTSIGAVEGNIVNISDGGHRTIYAMPGTTIVFHRGSNYTYWKWSQSGSGVTATTNGKTVDSDWTGSSNDNYETCTVNISGSATSGTVAKLVTCRGIIKQEEVTITIEVRSKESLISSVMGSTTYPVFLACLQDSRTIPGEPAVVGANFFFLDSGYKPAAANEFPHFASKGSGVIASNIGSNPNFKASADGTNTMGLVDSTGKTTKTAASGINWDSALRGIVNAGSSVKASNGDTVTSANVEYYEMLPYVIKLQTTTSLGWHIDCMVVPRDTATLSYSLNLPGGAAVSGIAVPNSINKPAPFGVTVAAPYTKVGENITDIPVGRKVTTTDNRDFTFEGWYTNSSGTGNRVDIGSNLTITENTVLYGKWSGGDYKVGTLVVGKVVETAANCEAPNANDQFTFSINNLSGSYPYKIYDATTYALISSETMTNGTFTLKANQTIYIENVPNGNYRITETNIPDYYLAEVAFRDVTIVGGIENIYVFTNTYNKPITHNVTGSIDHGTVTNNKQTVNQGQNSAAMVFTPAEGYEIVKIMVGSTEWPVTDKNSFTYPAQTNVTGAINVVVTTQLKSYAVTGTINNGTVTGGNQKVNHGQNSAVMTFTPDDGYEIATITINGVAQPVGDKKSFTYQAMNVKTSVAVVVTTTAKSYTITWIVDGVETVVPYEYGATIVKPADPSKEGHTFAGWDNSVPAKMPANDLTFTAQWNVNSYTVTWIVDGVETTVPYKYGETIVKPGNPSKEGHTFTGWSDYTDGMTMPDHSVTFTAQWEIKKNDVTYVDGAEETSIPDVNFGVEVGVRAPENRVGYTFQYWNVTGLKDVTTLKPGDTFIMPDNEVTLTAQWKINTHTVTWIVDGDKIVEAYNYGTTIEPIEDPTKEGHTFAGWDIEIPRSMPDHNVTLTAKWTVNSYTVTWIVDGVKTDETYEYGAAIAKPANPSKPGYNFLGWTPDVPATMPAENLTFTARFAQSATSLKIQVNGCNASLDPNQSFLFTVTGEGVNLKVGIVENGSVVIDGLTIGKEYTITIDNDWSWRYESKQDQISAAKDTDGAKTANSIKVTLEEGEVVTFTVTRENQWWLDGWWTGLLNKN